MEIEQAIVFQDNQSTMKLLEKALYGCVESGKLWYDLLSSKLCELGFTANDYECCVFNKYVDGHQVSICINVDDLFVT